MGKPFQWDVLDPKWAHGVQASDEGARNTQFTRHTLKSKTGVLQVADQEGNVATISGDCD